MSTLEPGTLYIVATPIGNMEDITLRALEVLKNVNVIYAEDTRVFQKLLVRYEFTKPLRSFREAASANQVERTIKEVCDHLYEGETVAYVSDAGTPGISDPGSFLVRKVVEAGFKVLPLPGPSSLTALLSASGFPVQRPLFVGFLPKKKGHQTLMKQLREVLVNETVDTLVFYESPERILKLLLELLEWGVELQVCLGRELTKMHEEIVRGSVGEVYEALKIRPSIKGEITLAIRL